MNRIVRNRVLPGALLATALSLSPVGYAQAPIAAAALSAQRINYSALEGQPRYNGRLIVYYRQGSAPASTPTLRQQALGRAASAAGTGLQWRRTLATGGELVESATSRDAASMRKLMEAIAADPDVAYVEPDRIMTIKASAPNDTYWSYQWDLTEATGGMNLLGAWDVATGSGVTVAVLDTGITPHSDLSGQILGGYDFVSDAGAARDGNGRDSNPNDEGDWYAANECGSGYPASDSSWHGTHVAGTIAAATGNSKGIAGVAPHAKVEPVRVLGKCGGSVSDIADAIVWASGGTVSGVPVNANPAKVINLSLGGGGACGSTFQNAINTARANGTVVVVAAGNENQNVSNASPANCSGVIAVAATNRSGGRASYSNYGSLVTVSAPGGNGSGDSNDILSTLNAGTTVQGSENYAFYAGTSMATPHVAGLAALILAKNGSLTPDQVKTYITAYARPLPGSCSGGCGAGIIDAAATLAAVASGSGGGSGNALQNGVARTGLAGASASQQAYTVSVPAGASNLVISISGGSGDADLYVRFGTAPTTSSYHCRPYLSGNNESCTFSAPQTGTYYIVVRGYSSYSGVSLKASWSGG